MIKKQEPPFKLTIKTPTGKHIAILPEKVDLELIFKAFEGLLINAGYKEEEINKFKK